MSDPRDQTAPDEAGVSAPTASGVELLESSQEESLRQRLEDAEARLKAVSSAYRGLQQEMSDFRSRLERQAAAQREVLAGDVVRRLFEPVQDLRRSLDALRRAGVDEGTLHGVDMVQRAFMSRFEELGLTEVPGVGAPFSPEVHEALSTLTVSDPAQDGIVLQVYSAGYRIHGRLVAPARVIIGRYTEPAGEA